MFTLCMFIFGSVVATEPVHAECVRVNQKQLQAAIGECSTLDKDPFTTCESQRVGALKVFIRVRQLDGV